MNAAVMGPNHMLDDDSPYRSPVTLDSDTATRRSISSGSAWTTLSFFGLPIFGGLAGFIGYLFAAVALENRDTTTEPFLSYGQQAGLISLPMCTLISAATGLGIAFSIARQNAISVLLLATVSLCGWAINNAFWSDQITRYGPDPSEAVLYYPPLACSGIALFTATVVAAWAPLAARKNQGAIS